MFFHGDELHATAALMEVERDETVEGAESNPIRRVHLVNQVVSEPEDVLSNYPCLPIGDETNKDVTEEQLRESERVQLEYARSVQEREDERREGAPKTSLEPPAIVDEFLTMEFVREHASKRPGARPVDEQLLKHMRTMMKRTHVTAVDDRVKIAKLFLEFLHVAAFDDSELGVTSIGLFDIDTGDARPVKQASRRATMEERKEIDEQLDTLLKNGIVEPSASPWASPIVLVRKKDGKWRFCIDYRALNIVKLPDAHPLPRIEECLEILRGNQYFTALDLRNGYWQMGLTTNAKAKTAFACYRGQYQFTRMPFGCRNAPGGFFPYDATGSSRPHMETLPRLY